MYSVFKSTIFYLFNFITVSSNFANVKYLAQNNLLGTSELRA